MSEDYYTGPVCYQDGWHYTVMTGPDGYDAPGEKLHLEDTADGSEFRYRLATEDDASWHDRKHGQYTHIEFEDGSATGVSVTANELSAIQAFLDERRGK